MIDDEQFFAWLDGELQGDDEARVAEAVAASPELTARAEQHRKLTAGLRQAFDPVLEGTPAPPKFQADVIDFGAKSKERAGRRSWFAAPQWAAMAASLAIGLVIGTQFKGGSVSPVQVDNGRLVAAAELGQALDTRLASAAAPAGPRIGLTFRDASGSGSAAGTPLRSLRKVASSSPGGDVHTISSSNSNTVWRQILS